MKAHCPIVTDVGMKENALKILMCYNPVWLRIGLYIIFGGESLLPNPNTEMNYDQEISFLKMVAEKLFFSHSGLAKAYIYNKLVEGLYRPGYYEKLGSVILKKFLLLVIILDRAKSQSSLPISYGIDGVDGGSPLLFTSRATIKSSSEVISGKKKIIYLYLFLDSLKMVTTYCLDICSFGMCRVFITRCYAWSW